MEELQMRLSSNAPSISAVYFSIMKSINTSSAATLEAAAQAHWASCARIFADSLHHFDSEDYKLRPVMVDPSEHPQAFTRLPFYSLSTCAAVCKNANSLVKREPPVYHITWVKQWQYFEVKSL
jgi:hypothetical protein